VIVERVDIENTGDRLQVVLHRNRYDFVLARLSPNQSVLEIGTGPGVFSKELFEKCGSYVGIEYDPEACLEARRKTQNKAEIIQADARNLPLEDNRFNFIICLEVLEHLGDWRAGVRNIHRCLQAGGMAIISVPYRHTGGRSETNQYHIYEPGENELVSCFKKYFENVEVYYQSFEETWWMTFARTFRIRRFVGLSQTYADLSAGLPYVTSKFRISRQPRGMKEGLILVSTGKKKLADS
jgi:ubiquinone/menaquinone biosynthesis C-methylase UbiE